MRSERSVTTACVVEFTRDGNKITAVSEDISRHGVFVRTLDFLPVGEKVQLTLYPPIGQPIRVAAVVASVLDSAVARTLGRAAGLGFGFLDHRPELQDLLDDLIEELTPAPREPPRAIRVLVVDTHAPLRRRVGLALEGAGMVVDIAVSGAEAFAACVNSPPDVVVTADKMPAMDGWTLIQRLTSQPRCADIPVVMLSDDASDMTRLTAYRLGVADFLPKPFTDDELAIRVGRCARPKRTSSEMSALRGEIGAMGLATLLSLLDFERKSGILLVVAGHDVARLFVATGRVVKVDSSAAGATALDKVLTVLNWERGNFEFVACDVEGDDEVNLSTQHLLMEHARRSDEANA